MLPRKNKFWLAPNLILVRFDLGSILSGFGQPNNNNNNQAQNSNDPVASLLGGLLNQNIQVTLNDQGQIQINKNNQQQQDQQQQQNLPPATPSPPQPNTPRPNIQDICEHF